MNTLSQLKISVIMIALFLAIPSFASETFCPLDGTECGQPAPQPAPEPAPQPVPESEP